MPFKNKEYASEYNKMYRKLIKKSKYKSALNKAYMKGYRAGAKDRINKLYKAWMNRHPGYHKQRNKKV